MNHEDAKKVARAAFAADGGFCSSCISNVLDVLIDELPQFDWVAIAREVAMEKIKCTVMGVTAMDERFEEFEYVGEHR